MKKIEVSETTKSTGALTLELIAKAQAGDIAARNQVIEMNMRLVAKRAHAAAKRCGKMHIVDDLIQTAVVGASANDGLIHAINKFDISRGLRFSTYAVRWIDNAIQNALTQTKVVRMGRTSHGEARLRGIIEELTYEDGCLPTAREVRARCVFLEHDPPSDLAIERALTAVREEEVPTDGASRPGADSSSRRGTTDLRALTSDANPVGELEDRELGRDLLVALDTLTPTERLVLERSFGLFGREPVSHKVLATELGVDKTRVGQLKRRALEKLQRRLVANHGESLRDIGELISSRTA